MTPDFDKFKFVGCLTVTGGVCFAGYKYISDDQISISSNNKTFLVKSKNSNILNLGNNYDCLLGTETDNNCQIISFNFKPQTYIDSKEIIDASTQSEKLIENSFYKLVLDTNKITAKLNDNETEITIKDQDKEAVLTIISLIDENKQDQPINFDDKSMLLVKADKNLFDETSFNNLKCKSTDEKHTVDDCKIYKFDDDSQNNLFDFSKIKKITKFNEIQASEYYVVDFVKIDKENIKNENIKKISIFEGEEKKTSFTFLTKIITNIEDKPSNPLNNQAIMLTTNFEQNKFKNTYIIAKSEGAIEDGFLSGKDKNYVCQIDTNVFDNNCSIISLNDERTLKKITMSNTQPTNLKDEGKYYKIFVNNEIVSKITTWNESKIINFVDKNNNSKIYGKLKPLFFIENGEATRGSTNLVIVTTGATGSNLSSVIFENASYTCSFETTKEEKNCDIYKFNDPQPDLTNIFDHLKNRLSKIYDQNDWKYNNLLLIDLKEQKFDISAKKQEVTEDYDDEENLNLKINISTQKETIAETTIKMQLINKSFNNGDVNSVIVI